MKPILLSVILAVLVSNAGCAQSSVNKNEEKIEGKRVGGPCEGCEAIYESPTPLQQLGSVARLPDFDDPGPKIKISRIDYKADGKTPAPGVILYVYHTDQAGVYPTKGDEKGWAKRHGYIRGWARTYQYGAYEILTLVPASYPNSNNPKHLHPVIKEPGKNEYWIEEFLFDDDPYLSAAEKNKANPRGGNGILKPVLKDGMLHATRNIILGLNVPGYPPGE
jgi:protocatechuate 3,4-dioxygenase beta subunit